MAFEKCEGTPKFVICFWSQPPGLRLTIPSGSGSEVSSLARYVRHEARVDSGNAAQVARDQRCSRCREIDIAEVKVHELHEGGAELCRSAPARVRPIPGAHDVASCCCCDGICRQLIPAKIVSDTPTDIIHCRQIDTYQISPTWIEHSFFILGSLIWNGIFFCHWVFSVSPSAW